MNISRSRKEGWRNEGNETGPPDAHTFLKARTNYSLKTSYARVNLSVNA